MLFNSILETQTTSNLFQEPRYSHSFVLLQKTATNSLFFITNKNESTPIFKNMWTLEWNTIEKKDILRKGDILKGTRQRTEVKFLRTVNTFNPSIFERGISNVLTHNPRKFELKPQVLMLHVYIWNADSLIICSFWDPYHKHFVDSSNWKHEIVCVDPHFLLQECKFRFFCLLKKKKQNAQQNTPIEP